MLQVLDKNTQLKILEEKFRRETFARLVVSGLPFVKAMRQAGYVQPNAAQAVELMQQEEVATLIERERALLREIVAVNKETVLAELEFAREFAVDQENPAAVVAASIAKAKIVGLFDTDKNSKVPAKIEISWGGEEEKVTIPKSSPLYEAVSEVIGDKK